MIAREQELLQRQINRTIRVKEEVTTSSSSPILLSTSVVPLVVVVVVAVAVLATDVMDIIVVAVADSYYLCRVPWYFSSRAWSKMCSTGTPSRLTCNY